MGRLTSGFALLLALAATSSVFAQASYTTSFEEFPLGPLNDPNGWGNISNSPTSGRIVPAPPGTPAFLGSQSLELFTVNDANFFVANRYYSPTIEPPAGEAGSTIESVPAVDPQSVFRASFWYRMPAALTSTRTDGRFAELNPSSKGPEDNDAANRYAQVRLINNGAGGVRVEVFWFTTYPAGSTNIVADGLSWGEWYRFEYTIRFVDGPPLGPANDVFTLSIFDRNGTLIATSACASTWESGWKTEPTFGDTRTARAVNGFDFWSTTGPNGTVVGHVDGFSISTEDPGPVALQMVSGDGQVAPVSTTLPAPLVVQVVDEAQQERCYPVSFAITATPPAATGQALGSPLVTPGSGGQAATTFTLGNQPGPYQVTASVAGAAGSPVLFTAIASLGLAQGIPTVGEWGLAALAIALAAAATFVLRRTG
jgi:hypothetical protein